MSTTIELNDTQREALAQTKECAALLDYGTEVPVEIMLSFLDAKSQSTQQECATALGYQNDSKKMLDDLRGITQSQPPPAPVPASGGVEWTDNKEKGGDDAPLRSQGFTDLYIVSRLLQLGVGPTSTGGASPQIEKGFIKRPISIGKKTLYYWENSAATIQKMFRTVDTTFLDWMYKGAWVEKKHVDLMLRQLDTMRDSLSTEGMKHYIDTRKALINASSLLSQVEIEAAKTTPDQKVLEKLLREYAWATEQYNKFNLVGRTPEFHSLKANVTNELNAISTDTSRIESDLKRWEKRQKLWEEHGLRTLDRKILSTDHNFKRQENIFAEKEKILNLAKTPIRSLEQNLLIWLKDELDDLEKELAEHNRRGGAWAGARPSAEIRNDIRLKKWEIRTKNGIITSIEDWTHSDLVSEKTAFDNAKSDLDILQQKKTRLSSSKKALEVKLTTQKEENIKLGTKYTEAQAKLSRLSDLDEMKRLLDVIESNPDPIEQGKAERVLQKMRSDIDPTSPLHVALNGTDTTTRRQAIEIEKTRRTKESLLLQWAELPTWMSEKQKEKILKARERIGDIYSQVDNLHKQAGDITKALETDPKIATADQFTKEANIKIGAVNDKITKLSPLIDDVIRDVGTAFPELKRDDVIKQLKVPILPNAGWATWMKKWNNSIETRAVNSKVWRWVFGALMIVGAGHAAYDGFTKEWVKGTAKELSDIGLWFIPGYDLAVAIKGETLAGVPGVQGRKLTKEERWIRAGFWVLSIIPIVGTWAKAIATSAKVINLADKVADGVKVSNVIVKTTDWLTDAARLTSHAATLWIVGSAAYNMAAPVFTSKKFKVALVDVNPGTIQK